MNLFYEEYPKSITVSGRHYAIVTDFREYIRLLDMLKDKELSDKERLFFLLQYFTGGVPDDKAAAIRALSGFIAIDVQKAVSEEEREDEEEEIGAERPLFSFSFDFPYILADFLREYGIDLKSCEYMHWWAFRELFVGLSESSETKKRMMYRGMDVSSISDPAERKRIIRIQRQIRLPEEELTDFDIGAAFSM